MLRECFQGKILLHVSGKVKAVKNTVTLNLKIKRNFGELSMLLLNNDQLINVPLSAKRGVRGTLNEQKIKVALNSLHRNFFKLCYTVSVVTRYARVMIIKFSTKLRHLLDTAFLS